MFFLPGNAFHRINVTSDAMIDVGRDERLESDVAT